MNSNVYPKKPGDQLKVAIKENQITLAPGSRTTIQVGVLNDSPNEDYVDVLVKGVPVEWVIIHTPVLQLASGEVKLVTLTVQPSAIADGRVGQYPFDVHVVSHSNPQRTAVARSVLTVAAYQSRGRMGVMLGSIHFSATPGTSIDIPILLQNRGDEEDSFRLNVTGLPANWVSSTSSVTRLEPGNSAEILFTLQVPRSPQAAAGRTRFTIQFTSQLFPTQTTDVECILTISAFSKFTASLEPDSLQGGQLGQVIVYNEGNTSDTYTLQFQGRGNELVFEKAVQVARPEAQPRQVGLSYVEIPQGERIAVRAGEHGVYPFRARLRSRPIIGNEETYPFGVEVRSTANEFAEVSGQVKESAYIQFWVLPVGVVVFLALCLLLLIPLRDMPTAARATQTAAFSQTQAALSGTGDQDSDGLTNEREATLGTNPLLPDSDNDRLTDREEVETYLTNPLDADTDDDRLPDGDEVQTALTDPRNPDIDGDGRLDGDEVAGGSDPRNPDSDGDGLKDGDEIKLDVDPRNPDTDGDGLKDGQENETCPRPSVPDSDNDGSVDGQDLDPCNPSNPALTATAAAGAAQATAAAPTLTFTATFTVTATFTPTTTLTPTTTNTPTATATSTPPLPSLSGILLFDSNRTGNSEIYALNLGNQVLARLTNNAAQDVQPALAPDSNQVAYVSNQDGSNEIYLTTLNGQTPLNLTKNGGDDQQPVWSPDGNWIAFTSNRDGNQEIYVMRRDGSELRNLTNHAANDFDPTWYSVPGLFRSQDWIAFTSTRDGNQEVYKVKPDGSGITNLTQNPANDHSPTGFAAGTILAFVSDRNGNSDVYTMTDAGGSQTNITNHPAQDLDPAFNPAGNWIAFSTDRDGNLEIYIVGTSGGTVYNLTKDPSQDRFPDW
jgi:WD40-like Beta Propeller Repeat/Bacterial TSP3 repeat